MYILDFRDQLNLMRKRIEMVQCNHESRKANKPNTDCIDIVSGIERNIHEQRRTSTNRVTSPFRCDNCLIERWTRRAAVGMPEEEGGMRVGDCCARVAMATRTLTTLPRDHPSPSSHSWQRGKRWIVQMRIHDNWIDDS